MNVASTYDQTENMIWVYRANVVWDYTFFSHEKQKEVGLYTDIDKMTIANILNGFPAVSYTENPEYYDIIIPLSETNFDFNMFPELKSAMSVTGAINVLNDPQYASLKNEWMGMIDFTIRVNHDCNQIMQVSIDFTDLTNHLFKILDSDIREDIVSSAVITISDLSTASISFNPPAFQDEFVESGYLFYNIDGEINDAYIDDTNKTIFYTLTGDHNLYMFNYETYELKHFYFDIIPDQITGNGQFTYVTLSDAHIRYLDGPEYGGLAVIDANQLSIVNLFALNFDPYDIVVASDGYLYVTFGSGSFGYLRGINPETGEITVSTMRVYRMGQLVYSTYTNRLYYVELGTTFDDLLVFNVDAGVISGRHVGDDGFAERELTVSPDGTLIYSLDGKIFNLNPDIESDGLIETDLDFNYNAVAFDSENEIYYFAKDEGIVSMNAQGEFIDTYKYAQSSLRLTYTNGLLINVGSSNIEIFNFDDHNSFNVITYTTINYGDDFNFDDYFRNCGFGNYTIEQISGGILPNALDSFDLVFQLSNEDKTYTYQIRVNIVDIEAPVITLDDDVLFELEVNAEFSIPVCHISDNFTDLPTCTIVENNFDISHIGNYKLTYKGEDSSGNVSYETFYFTVGIKELSYETDVHIFTGDITGAVYSEADNALFYILTEEKQIVRYDFDTDTETRLTFDYTPERLLIHDGKVYATIVHGEHSMYWEIEQQHGEIAVIDAETFTLDSLNWITVDPYSIVIIGNYIYIAPGSGQQVGIFSYNLDDFAIRHELIFFTYESEITTALNSNYIFLITTQSSPQQLTRITVLNGVNTQGTNSPYWGDYTYGDQIFQSFTGDYIFSSYGQAFYQQASGDNVALSYAFDFAWNIKAYIYDEINQVSMFGTDQDSIVFTNSGSLEKAYEVNIGYSVDELFGNQEAFYGISYTSTGMVFIFGSMAE